MQLIFNILFTVLIAVVAPSKSSVELVQVFFRHGSRTPEFKDTYPTDPYTEKDFAPMGWGQLTNEGKRRAYRLGQLLRTRYDAMLGDVYTPGIVHAQSTDFDRTKMSALLVLAGLFPPSAAQRWHADLAWMPIPYYAEKAENDFFLRRPTHYCPTYLEELQNVMRTDPRIFKILEENKQVLSYIEKHANKPMRTLMDVFQLYQTLSAEEALNMTLPQWTQEVYPARIQDLAGQQCFFENANLVLKKLNGGRSLSRVIRNIEEKIQKSTAGPKIRLYSGHENNVANILSVLDVFRPHVPKYSAAVIVELHNFKSKENDDHKVRILYARDVDDARGPEVQTIDGCEEFCPYQQFVDIMRPKMPVNYTEECRSMMPLD